MMKPLVKHRQHIVRNNTALGFQPDRRPLWSISDADAFAGTLAGTSPACAGDRLVPNGMFGGSYLARSQVLAELSHAGAPEEVMRSIGTLQAYAPVTQPISTPPQPAEDITNEFSGWSLVLC